MIAGNNFYLFPGKGFPGLLDIRCRNNAIGLLDEKPLDAGNDTFCVINK